MSREESNKIKWKRKHYQIENDEDEQVLIDLKTVIKMNHRRLKISVSFKQEKECSNLYLKIVTN